MAFTGKCTFSGGSALPEIAEDVADLVSIVAPAETPLLEALGDPHRAATSTQHEWFEDGLLANADTISMPGINDANALTTVLAMAHGWRFRVGDLLAPATSQEVMLVSAVNAGTGQITVARGYGGTSRAPLYDGDELRILSNALFEGQEAPEARFSVRQRMSNYTQIFAGTVQVSGSEAAVRQLAVEDELALQKTLRLRELLRDLENTLINGVAHDATPVGSALVRRTMRGLLASIRTNVFVPGQNGFSDDAGLTEPMLNQALRLLWEQSGSRIDLIVCGGLQKRRINEFVSDHRQFSGGQEAYKSLISLYESDYGVCRVVLSRYVPRDTVLLLEASRLAVVPLSGRSFHYKRLATTGDYESGELIGEYTLECRNEAVHGVIRGLSAA